MKISLFPLACLLAFMSNAFASTKVLYLVYSDESGNTKAQAIDTSKEYIKGKNVTALVREGNIIYGIDLLRCDSSSCLASVNIGNIETGKNISSTLVYDFGNHKSFFIGLNAYAHEDLTGSLYVMSYTQYQNVRSLLGRSLPSDRPALAPTSSNVAPMNDRGPDANRVRGSHLYYGPVMMQGGPIDPR